MRPTSEPAPRPPRAAEPGAWPAMPEIAQATLAARWLVLATLVVLEATTPRPATAWWAGPLLGGAILYSLAATLYAARDPDRADRAVRWTLPCDTILLMIGMQITSFPPAVVAMGFPLTVVAGLLTGYAGAGAVAAALALGQNPLLAASIFAPAHWVAWGLLALSLVAVGTAGAAAAARQAAHVRLFRTLRAIKTAIAAGGVPAVRGTQPGGGQGAAPAGAILDAAIAHFRADSGTLMLLDPETRRLEVLASHGADPSVPPVDPQAGEGIAAWIAQGGRAMLLTPGTPSPLGAKAENVRSSMCVAVAVGGSPVGVLSLNRVTTEGEFTRDDLDAAELAASAASGYLLRAQEEQRFSTALSALAGGHSKVTYALTRDPVVLWPALLDLVRLMTQAHFAVLALEREDTGNVEIVAARGLNGGDTRDLLPGLLAAAARGEIQTADGAVTPSGPRPPVTCVPLLVGDRTIGALGLGLPVDDPLPPPLLKAVVAHIAAAVDTTRTAHRVADIGAAEERRRIAREMHDGLAQTLANALLQVDLSAMTAQTAPAQLSKELRDLRALLEQAMKELREFMAELRRTGEADDRLVPGLELLARDLERDHHLSVTVVASGNDANLHPAVRHAVLAIARQALANVQAHAQATSVVVRADVTDEMCAVSITDNGSGFDLHAYRASRRPGHHLGLASMEERAALVGGRLVIDSTPTRGTTVTIQVPIGGTHG